MDMKKKMFIYDIAPRIAKIRAMLGKTQAEFAELMGVSENTISRYENGKNSPDYEFLTNVVDKSGCNPSWLFIGVGKILGFDYKDLPPPNFEGEYFVREDRAPYSFNNSGPAIRELSQTIIEQAERIKKLLP